MIRRDADGFCLLITQHDHALLSGMLARRVGNAMFASPLPFAPVITAIAQHDWGWQAADRQPAVNAEGKPRHVFECEIETALSAWAASTAHAMKLGPYAGLLVSLHSLSLAARAAAHRPTPTDETARRQAFLCSQFLHEQIEIQESLRRALGMCVDQPLHAGLAEPGRSAEEDLLLANFRLLQLMDDLSLALCFDRLPFAPVESLPPRPGESAASVRWEREPDGALRVDPWPFDDERLQFDIPARSIPARRYADARDLQSAYDAAAPRRVSVQLRCWHSAA